MKILSSSGIHIENKNWSLSCDATRKALSSLFFVSHAHSDHTTGSIPQSSPIICSDYTEILLKHFFPKMSNHHFVRSFEDSDVQFKQFASGHTLGSTALLVDSPEERIVFTGDVSMQKKGNLIQPFRPVKCDTLIIESTFGDPKFQFPPFKDEIKKAKDLVDDYLSRDIPVVLMGYAYGKAQILYEQFTDLCDTLILHGSNAKVQQILETFNPDLSFNYYTYQEMKVKNLLKESAPWILFAPLKSGRNEFNRYLKSKFNAKFFAFSGWCYSSSYKYQMDIDHAITISDHADFNELIEIVKKSEPKKIYTIYGSSIVLASELQKRGFNAFPLSKQKTLDFYF